MYIKELVIQGFKTFKDQTLIDPFHPKHNVIVGRNGSGKSNFFFAIEFVISDTYNNMRSDERSLLLHEGAGLAVMSAFVELKFDNSDGRFPVDREEVVIRRTIGLKKDEYFMDKKHVTKQEIYSILESAGFSRSNPYYIVRQGKVNELTNMKDNERLDLLKEVAGTRVYDDRRTESLKIMEDTDRQRKKITEVLEYIEDRLHELESEKEELKEYQKLDREKRCLEYTIYNKELEETTEKLEKIEASRSQETSKAQELYHNASELQERIDEAEKEHATLKEELAELKREKQLIDDERREYVKARAKIELDVRDGQENVKDEEKKRTDIAAELKQLEKNIASSTKTLAQIEPGFAAKKTEEDTIRAQLTKAEGELNATYARQSRGSRFSTKSERDAWLKSELQSLQSSTAKKQEQVFRLEGDIKKLKKKTKQSDTTLTELEESLRSRKQLIEKRTKEYQKAKKKRDDLQNLRKESQKKDSELAKELQTVTDKRRKNERALETTMAKNLRNGLNAVKKITMRDGIEGVHGPLIELFECEPHFATCVEVTAGSGLFNVVVDNDEIAARLLAELNRMKAGRVTFMPLNRLNPSEPRVKASEDDAIPMISKLDHDPRYRKAMMQIFGKTFICRTLAVASSLSKSFNINCVTLEGDQVSQKGAITGGFIDKSSSRMAAMMAIKECRGDIEEKTEEHEKTRSQVDQLDQQVTQTLAEVEKIKGDMEQQKQTYEQMKRDHKTAQEGKKRIAVTLAEKEELLVEAGNNVTSLKEEQSRLAVEVDTELTATMTEEEQAHVESLNREVPRLKRELMAASTERSRLEGELTVLKLRLENDLVKRQAELTEQLDEMGMQQQSAELDSQRQDLNQIEGEIKDATGRQTANDKAIDQHMKKMNSIKKTLEEYKTKEEDVYSLLTSEKKTIERVLSKRSTLVQRKDDAMRKIRELGSLPQEAFDKHKKKDHKQLMKLLQKCNEALKKYSHVNKKALDQYVNFSEQRDTLRGRKEELDQGAESIRDLVGTLDHKKDEAITRTFKGIAKAFSDVFKELVPVGSAQIVMTLPREQGEEGASKVDRYTGVAVKISFSGDDKACEMHQLSGGQKSLVALALIFAIQRTMAGGVKDSPDPAPFYLFDEIDAALDAAHRTAVANLIRRQAENAQFITTTFHPELCQHADKFYLISAIKSTKASRVDVIDKALAETFIHNTAREEADNA